MRASDVTERRVVDVWDELIPAGSPALMPGEEGIGKSTIRIRLMADLTRGRLRGQYLSIPQTVEPDCFRM